MYFQVCLHVWTSRFVGLIARQPYKSTFLGCTDIKILIHVTRGNIEYCCNVLLASSGPVEQIRETELRLLQQQETRRVLDPK